MASSASTHEVHDFDDIVGLEGNDLVLGARDDLSVSLDGHGPFQTEVCEQLLHCQGIRNFLGIPVHCQSHAY